MGTLARSDLTIALKEADKRVAPAVKCGAQQQLTPRHRVFIMCQFRFQYHASLVLRTLGGTLI
jgi:hypothetical protein